MAGSSPDKGIVLRHPCTIRTTEPLIVNHVFRATRFMYVCVLCDQRALFFASICVCAISTHYHETFSVWNRYRNTGEEVLSRRSLSMRLGFPQARNRNGLREWTFLVARPQPERGSSRGNWRNRAASRGTPRISGATRYTQPPDTVNVIYTPVLDGYRYDDDDDDDDDDRDHFCARISPYHLPSYSKPTYLFIIL